MCCQQKITDICKTALHYPCSTAGWKCFVRHVLLCSSRQAGLSAICNIRDRVNHRQLTTKLQHRFVVEVYPLEVARVLAIICENPSCSCQVRYKSSNQYIPNIFGPKIYFYRVWRLLPHTRSHSLQTKTAVLASVYRPPPFRFDECSWHAINGTRMGTPLLHFRIVNS